MSQTPGVDIINQISQLKQGFEIEDEDNTNSHNKMQLKKIEDYLENQYRQ